MFCSQSKQLTPLIEILTFITIIESRINKVHMPTLYPQREGGEGEREGEEG